VPSWAEREDKRVELAIEGRDVRVPPALAGVLPGALAHLVRNAVAHGIEPPHERTRAGKEPVGVVQLVAEEKPNGVVVRVEDDGRGFDEARIRARAAELGLAAAPPEDLVFAAGLSTRDARSELGGLGVGLDAVRADLAAVGYAVVASSTAGKGARFSLSPKAP
jgi:chemotaxis protein histidine kinase CheA